jgi:hypothetical protein
MRLYANKYIADFAIYLAKVAGSIRAIANSLPRGALQRRSAWENMT